MINWNRGLKRVAALFWGLMAIILTIAGAMDFGSSDSKIFHLLLIVLGWWAAYGMYRATAWVLDGFFDKSGTGGL